MDSSWTGLILVCIFLSQLASSEVTISLRPALDVLSLKVNEETQITCVVNDARPDSCVGWHIGDRDVDSKDYSTISQVGANGKATMNSVLKREFVMEENGKILQCILKADGLKKNCTADCTKLDIQFPPTPQTVIIMNGFEESKPGEVRVTVQANPRPHRAFWILPIPSSDKLEVEGKYMGGLSVSNYTGHVGEDNRNSTFTYRLNISSVQNRDANPGIKFQVFNMVGTSEASEQYCIQALTKSQREGSDDSQSVISWVSQTFSRLVSRIISVFGKGKHS